MKARARWFKPRMVVVWPPDPAAVLQQYGAQRSLNGTTDSNFLVALPPGPSAA